MEPHGSARAAAAFGRFMRWKLKNGIHAAPDAYHLQCTPQCRMYIDPKTPACTCVKGHAVHICGEDCALPPERMASGEGYVCPLSGIVVGGPDAVATPLFDADGRCVNHWGGSRRITKRPRRFQVRKRRKCLFTAAACLRIIEDVLFGAANKTARNVMVARATKRVAKEARQTGAMTFSSLRRIVSRARSTYGPAHAQRTSGDSCASLSRLISNYMSAHPACMTSTVEVGVCTWLTMLSTGLVKDGTIVVPCHTMVSQHIPHPSLMSLVGRVQCRAISVSVRQFKSYVFTSRGGVVHSRVFNNGLLTTT